MRWIRPAFWLFFASVLVVLQTTHAVLSGGETWQGGRRFSMLLPVPIWHRNVPVQLGAGVLRGSISRRPRSVVWYMIWVRWDTLKQFGCIHFSMHLPEWQITIVSPVGFGLLADLQWASSRIDDAIARVESFAHASLAAAWRFGASVYISFLEDVYVSRVSLARS